MRRGSQLGLVGYVLLDVFPSAEGCGEALNLIAVSFWNVFKFPSAEGCGETLNSSPLSSSEFF